MNNKLLKLKKELMSLKIDKDNKFIQVIAKNGMYLIDLQDNTCIGNQFKKIKDLNDKYQTVIIDSVDIENILIVGMSSDQVTILIDDII